MISFNNEHVFIRDLSDDILYIIFNSWWASINVGLKHPIAWNKCRHVFSWWIYWHHGIEATGSPAIQCIVSGQVLHHLSEHRISSIAKQFVAKAHITKWHEVTKSEVNILTSSMVYETPLAIPHQQKTFLSGWNGCVRVDPLHPSRQRHPRGGLLRAQRQYNTSYCKSSSDHPFAVSSCSVGLLFQTNILALCPTVTIGGN
jgi:hypothetical protein